MEIIKTKSFELATLISGSEDSKYLALLMPGRLDTKDYTNFESHLKYLAERGFLTVAFDPPGTWESPGDIDLYTTTNYIKAVNELVEYFGNRPTLLFGHSRGGTVSIVVAEGNKNIVGLIAVMPNLGPPLPPNPKTIRGGYKISYRDLPPGNHKTKEQKEFRLPIAYFEDGEKYDPADALCNLKKPKMIIFGNQDKLIDPETTRRISLKAPDPKIIRELSSGHDYRYSPGAIQEVNKLAGEFVDKFFPNKNKL